MRAAMAAAVWGALAWWAAAQGGFAAVFLFWLCSLILAYSIAVRLIGLFGVRVMRELRTADGGIPAGGVFETGEEAIVRVTLRRRFMFPLPWLIVLDRVGAAEHAMFCGAWWKRELVYEYKLELPQRGVFAFEAPELWSGDPFGVLQLRARARAEGPPLASGEEIAVAPCPPDIGEEARRALLALGRGRRGARRLKADADGDRLEFRAYAEGEPLSRVVWKLAARTGELKVRAWEAPPGGGETAVILQAGPGDDAAAADRCAAGAAGVLHALALAGRKAQLFGCRGAGPLAALPADWAGSPAAGGGAGAGISAAAGRVSFRRALAAWGLPEASRMEAPIKGRSPLTETAKGGLAAPAEAAVILCDVLRPETVRLARSVLSGGREALVLACGGETAAPNEPAVALRQLGVRAAVLPEGLADPPFAPGSAPPSGGKARWRRGRKTEVKGVEGWA